MISPEQQSIIIHPELDQLIRDARWNAMYANDLAIKEDAQKFLGECDERLPELIRTFSESRTDGNQEITERGEYGS